MKYWKKFSKEKLIKKIDKALESTVDFENSNYLGYPVSKLDENVFNTSGAFLNDSPLLKSFIANPNNIGCHTVGKSEEAFKGSQKLEKEVIVSLSGFMVCMLPSLEDYNAAILKKIEGILL